MTEDFAAIHARADSLVAGHRQLMRDLIALRKRHQLSQDAVAERMGVSQPTVASFERYDSNPTLSTIRRYANAVSGRIETTVVDDCADHMEQFDAIVRTSLTPTWTTEIKYGTWGPGVTRRKAPTS